MREAHLVAFLVFCLLMLVWVLLPLVPAWVTYRITPDQKLGLKGPLEALTMRVSGAFAAYLIVLLVMGAVVNKGLELVGSMLSPTWTVKAPVVIVDKDGAPISQLDSAPTLTVSFKPDIHRIGKENVVLKLPGDTSSWPLLTLQIPSFGGAEVDLTNLTDVMEFDHFRKTVELKRAIVIRQFPAEQLGFGRQPQ